MARTGKEKRHPSVGSDSSTGLFSGKSDGEESKGKETPSNPDDPELPDEGGSGSSSDEEGETKPDFEEQMAKEAEERKKEADAKKAKVDAEEAAARTP